MSTTKIEIFKDVTCVTHLFIDGVRVKWWTVTPSQLDIDIAIKNEQLKAESFLSFVGLTDPADHIEYEDRQEVLRSMGRMDDLPEYDLEDRTKRSSDYWLDEFNARLARIDHCIAEIEKVCPQIPSE